jgi:competence protein ComEC
MLEVLSPEALADEWNANSLVLAFTVGPIKVLLMADGNLTTEAKLLHGKHDLSAHILQVGHHGSAHGTSQRFLEAVNPQFAVVSVNRNNVNGYPAAQTLNRLKKQGSEVLLTSENGDIVFEIQPLTTGVRVLHNHE